MLAGMGAGGGGCGVSPALDLVVECVNQGLLRLDGDGGSGGDGGRAPL